MWLQTEATKSVYSSVTLADRRLRAGWAASREARKGTVSMSGTGASAHHPSWLPRRILYPSVSLRADCLSKDGLMCCSAILELFQTGCSCVSPLGSTITKKGQVLTSLGSSREVIRMRECTVAGTPQPARICGSSLSLDLLLLQHKS